MKYTPIEEMDVYRTALELAGRTYQAASAWPEFDRQVMGSQICRAADSIGANLVEGEGRGTARDGLRFFYYARASARETRHWVRLASDRGLLPASDSEEMGDLVLRSAMLINGLIRSRRNGLSVHETQAPYPATSDPFEENV